PQSNRVLHQDGFAAWELAYDTWGNVEWITLLDENGKPCVHKDGYTKIHHTYTANGDLTRKYYYDLHDQPCQHRQGYHAIVQGFDGNGDRVSLDYYDKYDRRVVCGGFASPHQAAEPDQRGKTTIYYGADMTVG